MEIMSIIYPHGRLIQLIIDAGRVRILCNRLELGNHIALFSKV